MPDLNKSLQQLEKIYLEIPTDESRLVTTIHRLRLKPLKDYEIEDLRIMISQNHGLPYLLPVAIEKLKEDILAEGDFYEGDLLKAVLTSDPNYWKANRAVHREMIATFKRGKQRLKQNDTTDWIRKGWFDGYEVFRKLS